jgi:hypothetical protein
MRSYVTMVAGPNYTGLQRLLEAEAWLRGHGAVLGTLPRSTSGCACPVCSAAWSSATSAC